MERNVWWFVRQGWWDMAWDTMDFGHFGFRGFQVPVSCWNKSVSFWRATCQLSCWACSQDWQIVPFFMVCFASMTWHITVCCQVCFLSWSANGYGACSMELISCAHLLLFCKSSLWMMWGPHQLSVFTHVVKLCNSWRQKADAVLTSSMMMTHKRKSIPSCELRNYLRSNSENMLDSRL